MLVSFGGYENNYAGEMHFFVKIDVPAKRIILFTFSSYEHSHSGKDVLGFLKE